MRDYAKAQRRAVAKIRQAAELLDEAARLLDGGVWSHQTTEAADTCRHIADRLPAYIAAEQQ